MPVRNEIRRARYAQARRLGYTRAEAKKVADRPRAEPKIVSLRSENVKRRERYAEARREGASPGEARVIRSGGDKRRSWSRWSNVFGDGFPDFIDERIVEANRRGGQPDHARYGYRRVYARYVLGVKDDDVSGWYHREYEMRSNTQITARRNLRRRERAQARRLKQAA